jgi:hypothetical protein
LDLSIFLKKKISCIAMSSTSAMQPSPLAVIGTPACTALQFTQITLSSLLKYSRRRHLSSPALHGALL